MQVTPRQALQFLDNVIQKKVVGLREEHDQIKQAVQGIALELLASEGRAKEIDKLQKELKRLERLIPKKKK